MQALIDLDDHPPFGDLTRHSKWSFRAQGYLTLRIASAVGAPRHDLRGHPLAEAFLRALADAIRFTMMEYCVGRALQAASGGRPAFALLLAPPDDVDSLAGRSALVYGHDDWRWVADEVAAPATLLTAAQGPLAGLAPTRAAAPASAWANESDSWTSRGPSLGRRLGEYSSLTEALCAALAAGYLLLAAVLERAETAQGTQWRPVALP
jgi:hypothetical protein